VVCPPGGLAVPGWVRVASEAGLGRGAPPVARRAGLGEASASGDGLAGQGCGRRGPAREERAAPGGRVQAARLPAVRSAGRAGGAAPGGG